MQNSELEKKSNRLLSCPFCGGEAVVQNPYPKIFMVWCKDCRIGTTNCQSRKQAISKWNTRKPMQRIVERLEERRAVFDCRVCRHFDKGDGSECNEDCTDALIDDLIDIVKGGVDNAG